jgi:hypothetical protein
MAEFAVLDAAREEDRRSWLSAWDSWPDGEVFAHPDYVSLFGTPDQRSLCARYEDEGGDVLFPFHLRSLSAEPWCPRGLDAFDVASPYGYGGPFSWGRPAADGFWRALGAWARDARVVSGFLRRGLFRSQLLPLPAGETLAAENVVRDLRLPPESIWMDYEHKVRKNVNKARRAGLRDSFDPRCERLADLVAIYRSTMDRRNASAFYRFESSFFEALLRALPGKAILFHVLDASDRVLSSELVLASTRHLYSFLGGTLPEALPLGANDLLKHAIVGWGQEQGKEAFVLGGGARPGDSIFRYKRSFAPRGVTPFHVGRLILDSELYARLVAARREWEDAQGRPWDPEETFFPAYRAPARSTEQKG